MSTSQDLIEGLRFHRDDYLRQEAALEARLELTRQVVRDLSLLVDNFDLGEDGLEELQAEPPPARRPTTRKPRTTKPKTKKLPMSPEFFDGLLMRARLVAKTNGPVTAMALRDQLHISDDQARKVIKRLLQNGELLAAGRATGGRGTPPALYALKNTNGNA